MRFAIPTEIQWMLQRLENAGFSAWLVGGCVRDLVRGVVPADWDGTSSARPEQVLALFGEEAIPTGLKHGTVTICHGSQKLELTTFRKEGTYTDGRRPDCVSFTDSILEDLARRDFTIGAMAWNLHGDFLDPYGGQDDLRQGILRCVGQPEARFREDALRILRGLRFASTLGLRIEENVAEAMFRCQDMLSLLAAERVRVEVEKLLCGRDMGRILRDYGRILGKWIPELLPTMGFEQHNRHHCFDVWEHTIRAMEAVTPLPVLRWTLLLHDIGKPICFTWDIGGGTHFFGHPQASHRMTLPILQRLRFSRAMQEQISILVLWHDSPIPLTDASLLRALHDLGEENLRLLLQVKRADNLAQHPNYQSRRQAELTLCAERLEKLLQSPNLCYRREQMAIRGADLLAMGIEGKRIGKALDMLLEQILQGKVPNTREALEEALQSLAF